MEVERIFSADQIIIHPDLPKIIKDFTKAVIKAHPEDILAFGYDYFKQKVHASDQKYIEAIENDFEQE